MIQRTKNELPTPGQSPFDPWYQNSQIALLSIQELEDYLNDDSTNKARNIQYNFLSNLPQNVRDLIKNQAFPSLSADQNPTSAFLLAEPANLDSVITDTSVWHDRVLKNVAREAINLFDLDSSQVSVSQDISPEQRSFSIGSHQISVSQVAATDFGIPQFRVNQIGIGQVNTEHGGVGKSGPGQVSPAEVSPIQTNGIELSSDQTGTAQIHTFHVGVIQIQPTKIDITQVSIGDGIANVAQPRATEIPLPSSITLQQFFSSHNLNLQNTTIPTWTEFLTGTTPFNLNIEITDLPTGQLAEANITHFDSNGRPTSGTLTLDHNANGLGWFIDSTPGTTLNLER